MIDKINNNPIQDFFDGTVKQPSQAKAPANNSEDASIQINYADLIEKATEKIDDDAQAVAKAKELLESGQLDNPELIRQAAENIIKFGYRGLYKLNYVHMSRADEIMTWPNEQVLRKSFVRHRP